MTNFDFLKKTPAFVPFAEVAISAEKILHIDSEAAVLNCRRAMEFAVKWMYSVDNALTMPYNESLQTLIDAQCFRSLVGFDIWKRMDIIRKLGNSVAHDGKKVTMDEAELCLENLFIFLDCVDHFYNPTHTGQQFDKSLLSLTVDEALSFVPDNDIDIFKLIEENKALRSELTARRTENQQTYVPKPLEISEYKTRKIYIDFMLKDAGWTQGKDWQNEVELLGMPNKSGVGYADYVLYGDDGKPLAVLEAKRTCVDVSVGRQQAKLYADLLEKKYGRRPIIFLSNGFDTQIWDDRYYNERTVASIYSKSDLEKLFNLRYMRRSINNVMVDKDIAGRYYQEGAIKAVCETFDKKNKRKALLVMATGSGKTRTVIALCKVLIEYGWVKNILFLADRYSLVSQARKSFGIWLPELSATNLCDDKKNYDSRCVFSTYQTIINCIDTVKDKKDKKLFTVGHFDLVIVDEAHRSIYNKYKDVFNYFDAPLVGLTATPKDEIDKNTYRLFELQEGIPTYGYELSQAVKDGFLVDFMSIETKLKFVEEGIVYDDLSAKDKELYENTFEDENGNFPETISSNALNEWVFNDDTIRQVINILMQDGLRIDYGEKLGKTIIFAKNHKHAKRIHEIFCDEYPNLPGYTMVIDNQLKHAQQAIEEFSDPKKLPQIAISVDMLDTGVDIPEVLNLVFFKKVMSKAKFWQMIGRGTRRCDGLIDGKDKEKFYIFDFCGNFEFFRISEGNTSAKVMPLQGAIFNLKAKIVFKLQDLAYQTEELIKFRKALIDDMVGKVRELNRKNFAVRQHLRYVELFSDPDNYKALTHADTILIEEELAPLITPDSDEASAVRFDALMYGIELAYLMGKKYSRGRLDLMKKVKAISSIAADFPEIIAQSELINKILHTNYLDNSGINEFENIRQSFRELVKYLSVEKNLYYTNLTDKILSVEWNEADLENDDLLNYKMAAESYIRQHQNETVITKLKGNIPLDSEDIKALEHILWSEVGSREDYEAEYGNKPLGEFVREIVGLDMAAAKSAFSKYLNDVSLDSDQIYFVNQIVEYIVRNGVMKDMSVLQEPPFTDRGSVAEVFTDISLWLDIKKIIDQINSNAAA